MEKERWQPSNAHTVKDISHSKEIWINLLTHAWKMLKNTKYHPKKEWYKQMKLNSSGTNSITIAITITIVSTRTLYTGRKTYLYYHQVRPGHFLSKKDKIAFMLGSVCDIGFPAVVIMPMIPMILMLVNNLCILQHSVTFYFKRSCQIW